MLAEVPYFCLWLGFLADFVRQHLNISTIAVSSGAMPAALALQASHCNDHDLCGKSTPHSDLRPPTVDDVCVGDHEKP